MRAEAELDREDLPYAVKAHASVVPGVREDNVGDLSRSVVGNDSGRNSDIQRDGATGRREESPRRSCDHANLFQGVVPPRCLTECGLAAGNRADFPRATPLFGV